MSHKRKASEQGLDKKFRYHTDWVARFQEYKADVILNYNAEEARNLKAYRELLDHVKYQ